MSSSPLLLPACLFNSFKSMSPQGEECQMITVMLRDKQGCQLIFLNTRKGCDWPVLGHMLNAWPSDCGQAMEYMPGTARVKHPPPTKEGAGCAAPVRQTGS